MSINAVQNKFLEGFKPRLGVNQPLNHDSPNDTVNLNANTRNVQIDKKAQKVIDESIKLKGVEPKFINDKDQTGGGFDPATGNMSISPKYEKNNIWRLFFKPVLRHESKHAEQFALISMLPGGIESLNLLIVKNNAKDLSQNEKNEIINAYKQTQMPANDMNAAIYAVLTNPNIAKEQVPIVINKSFYEKAKQAHGPLTKEEENKAREYLKAYENYPADIKGSFINKINPFSDYWKIYRKNILEAEAFKTMPWYIKYSPII